MAAAPPRFAVDRMLGRLTLWLRLTGHDASAGPQLTRQALLRHARAEGRTILTRDRWMLRQHHLPPLVFIDSDHFRDQLRQIVRSCHLEPFAQLLTRCARCNSIVHPVDKEAIRADVPEYVFATQQHFARCPLCHRIYWPATHLDRVREELRRMGFATDASART